MEGDWKQIVAKLEEASLNLMLDGLCRQAVLFIDITPRGSY